MNPKHFPAPDKPQIQALRNYLVRKPEDGRAWLVLAQLLSHNPPGDELRNAVRQSIVLLPDNFQAWLLAAKMQKFEHSAAAVLDWLEQSAKENPGLVAPRLAGASLRSSSDPDGAIVLCNKILATSPQDARAHILLAQLLQKQGKLNAAGRSLEAALQITPGSAEYWSFLAQVRLKERRPEVAVEAATRSLQLDENLLAARGVRAEAYQQAGCWTEALADYQELMKQQAQSPILLNKIGVCLIRLEQFDSAAEHFEKALQLDPGFAVAKLNIGLLCATQMKADEAASRISEVLDDPGIEPATRQSAQTTLDVLAEQKRLKPFLEHAEQTRSFNELHAALEETPATLLQPDKQGADSLWKMADLCRELQFNPQDFLFTTDTTYLPFIEACAQSKLDCDGTSMAQMYLDRDKGSGISRKILNAQHLHRDRLKLSANLLQQGQGEAWLRYWQARLLRESPEKNPGQYKAIQNTIGHRTPTPPESVASLFRLLLSEIRPSVPAGLASGLFIHIAISMIHGFGDGNGRLGRFLLGWETESAGMPAVFIPPNLLADLNQSLDKIILKNKPELMVVLVKKAHAENNRLLQQFNSRIAKPGA